MNYKFIICLCMQAIVCYSAKGGLRDSIDNEIDSMVKSCINHPSREVLCKDAAYSATKLNEYLCLRDSLPCIAQEIYTQTYMLRHCAKGEAFGEVIRYIIAYVQDSSNKMEGKYDILIPSLRYYAVSNESLPEAAMAYIGTKDFYKSTNWELPLLVSYLDMYKEVDNLKIWGKVNALSNFTKDKLLVSLLRLKDSETTKVYIKKTPKGEGEWDTYLTGLNYARTKPCADRLVLLLDNNTKIVDVEYSDGLIRYTTVRSKALEMLSIMVVDFPLNAYTYHNEQDFKQAKQWFKKNPNYKIIRNPSYVY